MSKECVFCKVTIVFKNIWQTSKQAKDFKLIILSSIRLNEREVLWIQFMRNRLFSVSTSCSAIGEYNETSFKIDIEQFFISKGWTQLNGFIQHIHIQELALHLLAGFDSRLSNCQRISSIQQCNIILAKNQAHFRLPLN